MAAQRIGSSEFATPVDAVRWMLALQGQDFAGVRWSVGLRHAGATEARVLAALDAGEIVRRLSAAVGARRSRAISPDGGAT
jgi:hypothetical protein